jgi:serine protease Do
MQRSKFISTLIIIFFLLAGILIGNSVLDFGLNDSPKQPEPIAQKEEPAARIPDAKEKQREDYRDSQIMGRDTVREIVAACGDSVIKIETEATVTSNSNPFFNDPFFREFFGNSFPQETKKQTGLGSGFLISEDGYILTNNHVIDGADKILVYSTSREEPYEAKVMGKAPELDLAVIKIDGDQPFPYLEMGNSDLVEVGDWVIAIGNPYGLDHTVTVGVISAMGRPLNIEGTIYQNLFQTDAAINPGNSGGPMLNLQGQVIGINTAVNASAQGIGFAIPARTALDVVDELKAGVDRVRPWVGINMQPLTPELSAYFNLDMTEGVIIYEVVEGAPADAAGLKRGDVILSLDGQKITTAEQIQGIIRSHKVGDQVEFVVLRNGAKASFMVRLEASK